MVPVRPMMVISAIRSSSAIASSTVVGTQLQARAYGAPARENISTPATSTSSIRAQCCALADGPPLSQSLAAFIVTAPMGTAYAPALPAPRGCA